jgi:hypothetical protein
LSWIGAIVQGVSGAIQMGISMDQLSKLPSAKTFSPATDLETATSMARRAAQQGMTPQERAAAEQAIGTAQSRTQRAMEQRGLGNLAAAVSQIRTTEAMNQLEAQNQAIKRQSLGQYASLAGQMQSIQNQNIQSFNQMLYAQQQALGQAAQAGFKNLAGTGATIAEAIEGKQAVEDKTFEGTPGGKVTTGQMGVTDTTTQQPVQTDYISGYQAPSTFSSMQDASLGQFQTKDFSNLGQDLYSTSPMLSETSSSPITMSGTESVQPMSASAGMGNDYLSGFGFGTSPNPLSGYSTIDDFNLE